MKVHKQVPLPPDTRNTKYPFGQLDPGDTLFIEDDETFERARRAAQSYGKQHGWQFSARKHIGVDEVNGDEITVLVESGGTIWRTK